MTLRQNVFNMLVSNNSGGGRPLYDRYLNYWSMEVFGRQSAGAGGRAADSNYKLLSHAQQGVMAHYYEELPFCSRLFPHELTWGIWFSQFGNNERKKEGAKTGKLRSESSHLKKNWGWKKNPLWNCICPMCTHKK